MASKGTNWIQLARDKVQWQILVNLRQKDSKVFAQPGNDQLLHGVKQFINIIQTFKLGFLQRLRYVTTRVPSQLLNGI